MNDSFCKMHEGHEERIKTLEDFRVITRDDMKEQRKRVDGIFTRLNIMIGSLALSCVLLLLNLIAKGLGG